MRWMVALAVVLTGALALSSCRTVVPVVGAPSTAHDTVWQRYVERDSVYLRDSLVLTLMTVGDTVYVDRETWHEVYNERVRMDTVYVARVDTVRVTVPVPTKMGETGDPWRRRLFWMLGWVSVLLLLLWVSRKW